MKRLSVLLGFMLIVIGGAVAQQLNRVEYFWDTDPGFGNGTALSVATVDSVNSTFVISTTGLTSGLHTLYVRSRNTNGAWSVFSRQMVHIQSPIYPIVAAEYFFDTDPGFGNGTPLSITPGDSVDITQTIPTTGLQTGLHTLYVRVKNSTGNWSVYSKAMVHIQSVDAGPIVAAEYFIDTDPGFGNGTPISITPGDSIDLTVPISTTGLNPGIHTVYVRVKNASGAWSVFSKDFFNVEYPQSQGIVAAEYFIDSDPGFGNGTPITITPGDSVLANFQVPTGSLSPGLHMLYVRVKDGDGKWSVYSKSHLYIDHRNDAQIVQAEYFVDSDPGIGNATPVTITPGDSVLASFQIPTNTLLIGTHTAYVRVKDSYGNWSVYSKDTFYVGNFNCFIYGNGLIELTGDTCRGSQITFTDRVASQSGVPSNNYIREWDFFNDGTIDFTPDSVVNYTFNTPGTYTVKLTTKEIANPFCRETVLKTFTIRNIDSTTVNVSICSGQSYYAGGAFQTTSGTYYDVLNNRYGCDSVVTTHLTVVPNVTPSVSLSASQTSFCSGTSVLFTATPTNGGVLPYYRWYVNGNLVFQGAGIGYSTYGTSSLQNNDVVTVEMTSSATCTSVNPVTSNAIQVSVTPSVSASVTIAVDTNNFCYGTTATFTITATSNEGSNPQYAWYRNNTLVQNGGTSYTASDLTNGEFIRCYLTSNATCVNNSPVSSNIIYMTVYSVGEPFVAIQPSANNICYGTPVTFYTVSLYHGNNPEYRWFLNGNLVQAGPSTTYSNNALDNGDEVFCVLVSDYQCRTADTDTSNTVIMNVIYSVPVSVSLSYSDNDICEGQNVSFTATPTPFYGGETYTWYKNGQIVQSGTNRFYNTNTLMDEDSVWVVLETSPLSCASGLPVSSDTIYFNVAPNVTVDVTITVTDDEICEGTPVTFTATPTHEGTNPMYYWYINNTYQPGFGNGSSFSSNHLGNGNQVKVVLLSSIECALNNPATSNIITMTVYDTLMPAASITATQTTICAGTQVDFDLTITNEGSNPTIEWLVNGNVVQTGGLSYSSSSLQNFDQILVRLTSDYVCPISNPVWSNTITMTVFEYFTPTVVLNVAPNPACPGNLISLVATPFNGGSQPQYTFYKNNTVIQSGQQNTYTSSSFADGDVVYVVMTSNYQCLNTPVDTSNIDTISIQSAVPAGVSITATTAQCVGNPITFTATPVNGGLNPEYRWKVNNVLVQQGPDHTFTVTGLNNGDQVVCEMLSSLSCATNNPATSNTITIQYNSFVTPSVDLTASANDVCEGTLIVFTAIPTNGGSSPTYVWRVNTTVVQSGPSDTYSTNLLNNGDVVSVEMTSSEPCTNINPVSDQITMIINQCSRVEVSLQAVTVACQGDNIVLTAIPVNGGTNPNFEFFVNGVSVQNGSSPTYTITNAQPGTYEAYVVLTSSLQYVTNNPATSSTITITVNQLTPVSVTITADTNNVCENTLITFTASVVNGGNNPLYVWYVNNNQVLFHNQPTLSGYFNNADEVYVEVYSNAVCPYPYPSVSNTIMLNFYQVLPVSVSINVDVNDFCYGTTATFTASSVNEGINPQYDWYVNGILVQSGGVDTYSSSFLNDGDEVWCVLTSSELCTSNNPAISNTIEMNVLPNLEPAVNISSNYGLASCVNDSVIFTATPVYGGNSPTFEWFVNGTSEQLSGSNIFYLNTSATGNFEVEVVMTSDYQCAINNPATSNTVNFTVSNALEPEVFISSTATSICPGQTVFFEASHVNGGLMPSFEWFINGVAVSTGQSFSYSQFSNGDSVFVVLTSSLSCATPTTDTSDMVHITVTQNAIASVYITATATTICSGQSVTFYATAYNTGMAPVYNWYINNQLAQSGSADYFTTNLLSDGDSVWVQMISNDPCVAVNTVYSNSIVMTVGNLGQSSVGISTPSADICRNELVTFTATPVNGGSSPFYEWFINGQPVQAGNSNTFVTNTLQHGDVVHVVMTSNDPCVSNQTAVSNQIVISVGTVQASVSLSASSTSVCVGQQVTVTANPVNGGTAPIYQWFVNGIPLVSGPQNSYTIPATTPGVYSVYVLMTSDDSCVIVQTVTSNTINIVVTSTQASVSIAANANNVCPGTPVTFTATPVNGGTSPLYEWLVNGTTVQSGTSSTFTSSSLANGSVVQVRMTSNDPCVSNQVVSSNTITVNIVQNQQASVTITLSNNNVCVGTAVMVTATAVNGGSAPIFDFRVNGISVQVGASNTYTAVFNNGDVITCVMTSNNSCVAIPVVTSNAITMIVNQPSPLNVSIQANPGTEICPGDNVVFTAVSTNAGPNPTYVWTVNGTVVSTQSFFQTTTLNNGDTVAVLLTSNASCLTTNTAIDAEIITVGGLLVADVSIIAVGGNTICSGSSATFVATPVNGGNNPQYQWLVNGVSAGINSPTFTATSLQDGDSVQVIMISNNNCVANAVVSSNTIAMNVIQTLTPTVSITGPDSLCSGNMATYTAVITHGGMNPSFVWTVNGVVLSTTSTLTYIPEAGDTITVQATSNYPCVTTAVATATFRPVVSETPLAKFTTTDSLLAVIFSNYMQENTRYDWYFGDGSNALNVPNPIHIYSREGNYTVTLIATNACGSDTSVMVVQVGNVGLDETLVSLESMALYPNPTENIVHIEVMLRHARTVHISWFDAVGKELHSQALGMLHGHNKVTFDLSHYAKGMYSVWIDTGDFRIVKKIIVH